MKPNGTTLAFQSSAYVKSAFDVIRKAPEGTPTSLIQAIIFHALKTVISDE
jgi:hypothetical protein